MERILYLPVLSSPAGWLGALAGCGVPAAYWQAEYRRWCHDRATVTVHDVTCRGIVGRDVAVTATLPVSPAAAAVRASLPTDGEAAGGWQRLAALAVQAETVGAVLTADEWLLAAGIALGLDYLDVTVVAAESVGTGAIAVLTQTWVTTQMPGERIADRVGYGICGDAVTEATLGYRQPVPWTQERPYVFGDTARARGTISEW